ncbi:polyketide synthase, putative [Talaromyces stipitatus ATCC 10500]|uniref:Polyketide synthase, putative n=1 Tax=Talaromyces stipitatus (strain ATCC 10500 / CBS 375.48 / QM 6759 / NRRL 1006) TaxID=441959 RepID=B8LX28_TALSN|nr:polyketide synthase, putative [Talaromyces stipitatus ATCC 10500]EED22678.1 polyketide synthase, putative [Talaromyces stipitatus ATCC 10500]
MGDRNSSDIMRPSAAFFCPQNKPPKPSYLDLIRRYLRNNATLQPFRAAILDSLFTTWKILGEANPGIAALTQGPRYIQHFHDWIAATESPLTSNELQWTEIMSGIISLPLLTVMQIVQYFQYLETRQINHEQFVQEIRIGGAQGYCGGLLPAAAIAASRNEEEVVKNACIALRLALAIGAYGELGDDENITGPTTVVLRTKYSEQAEEIVSRFPGTYVSAITDPETISIVGPVNVVEELRVYAEGQGIKSTKLHLRGKVHNPENEDLCKELSSLCQKHADLLMLPTTASLQCSLRSNKTGKELSNGDVTAFLSEEVQESTLASKCEWYNLLNGIAEDLDKASKTEKEHTFALFGTGRKNCVPTTPFEEKNIRISKLDVMIYVEKLEIPRDGRTLNQYPENAIAIVGAGCRLPGANSIDELWEILSSGASRVEKLRASRFDLSTISRGTVGPDAKEVNKHELYGNFIDDVESFDSNFFGISPREAMYMDPQQRLLLETAYEALDGSGYLRNHRREDFDNVGCFIGASYTEYLENTSSYNPTAYTATGTIRAFQSGRISYHFGWSGPSEVIDTACSASLVAVNRACKAIQSGECPMALAGGVNIITGVNNYFDLGKAGFLSATGQCKPFDEAADGYCRADGVGLVALKSLRQAMADENDVLGVIMGVGTNQGGLSPAITVPYYRAQIRLFKNVLQQSGLKSEQISYIEAHGTGTQVGDPIEISSVREVFGNPERTEFVNLGSLKANVGHSETAAGIGSLMKVLAMLKNGKIPPLAGFKSLNPKIPALEPDYLCIPTELQDWDVSFRVACVNSYGAAGSNSALICGEAPKVASMSSVSSTDQKVLEVSHLQYPILLSGANNPSLKANAAKLASYIRSYSNAAQLSISDIAFTLYHRRKHHKVQWTGLAHDLESLCQSLDKIEQGIEVPVSPKAVVLAFSGQSKQTIGLNPSWYVSFPRLRYYIDLCNDTIMRLGYSAIFPAVFATDPVEDVVALQCGTFAVQYACAKCWIDAKLDVKAAVGHSFGELTAMAVTGVLSLEDALNLVATRASLMQRKWGAERGTMLAVEANLDTTRQIISAVSESIEIACYNGQKSHVLVGTETDIGQVERFVATDNKYKGTRCTRVKTSHGFHSVFTEPLLQDLDEVAQRLRFEGPSFPLESCIEKPICEGDQLIQPSRIVQHTRTPVYFGAAVSRLEERLGSCIWLEAGSDSPIIPMIRRATQDPSKHTFLGLRTKDFARPIDVISQASMTLWQEGISASCFEGFYSSMSEGITLDIFKHIWLPPYQFQRTRHWLQYMDAVTEERRAFDEKLHSISRVGSLTNQTPMPSQKLVTARSRDSTSWSSLEFVIHSETSRFTDIVSAHAVRDQPLCPASMYMECVVMAAQMAEPSISVKSLSFQNLSFQGALGINYNRDVSLLLEGDGEYLAWNFTVGSTVKDSKGRLTTHAKGKFSVTSHIDFQVYERMLADRMNEILVHPQSERLMAGRAYTLFSRVVNYAETLRGISEITILNNRHAVAEVCRPKVSVSSSESTAVSVCDTVTLDTFIQVVGLLINSSETCPVDEVFIATGIDNIIMQDCDFTNLQHDTWKVYAMATTRSESHVAGDMFVFTKDGKLIFTGSGVQFSRFPISKLEKVLEGIGMNNGSKSPISNNNIGRGLPSPPASPVHVHMNEDFKTIKDRHGLRVSTTVDTDEQTLVGQYSVSRRPSALKSAMVKNDSRFGTLGLDSMSKLEFVNQLRAQLGDEISPTQDLSQVADLYNKLFAHNSTTNTKSVHIDHVHEIELDVPLSPTAVNSPATAGDSQSKLRIRQRILELITENSGESVTNIKDEVSLQDIGIDSLSVIELKESFEDVFGLQFGDWDFGLHLTVRELLDYVVVSGNV